MIANAGPTLEIEPTELLHDADPLPGGDLTIEELGRRQVRATLERGGCRVRGAGGAAERLGLEPSTLVTRMKTTAMLRRGIP